MAGTRPSVSFTSNRIRAHYLRISSASFRHRHTAEPPPPNLDHRPSSVRPGTLRPNLTGRIHAWPPHARHDHPAIYSAAAGCRIAATEKMMLCCTSTYAPHSSRPRTRPASRVAGVHPRSPPKADTSKGLPPPHAAVILASTTKICLLCASESQDPHNRHGRPGIAF